MIDSRQLRYFTGYTLAAFGLPLALLLSGCATTRPDPGKYLTPTDHGTYTFDEKNYTKALDVSNLKEWKCVLADAATTVLGLCLGLSEASPFGVIVIPMMLASHIAAAKERDAGRDGAQRIENAVHCGAAALNVVTIVGAL